MNILQYVRNRIIIARLKKRYYKHHYKMWDFIAAHIMQDSSESLKDSHYIDDLKSNYVQHNALQKDMPLYNNCYLCTLYYGTVSIRAGCRGCPLYNEQGMFCSSTDSWYQAVHNDLLTRKERAEYAGKIRDCALKERRK